MNYKAHETGGILFGIVIFILVGPILLGAFKDDEFIAVVTFVALLGGSFIGSLLPDLDQPSSKISCSLGIITKGISKTLNKLFGHRGFTHTIWFAFICAAILVPGYSLFNFYPVNIVYTGFIVGILIGVVSHLCLDSLTEGKIKPLYPLSSFKVGVGLVKNNKINWVYVAIILLLLISIFYNK